MGVLNVYAAVGLSSASRVCLGSLSLPSPLLADISPPLRIILPCTLWSFPASFLYFTIFPITYDSHSKAMAILSELSVTAMQSQLMSLIQSVKRTQAFLSNVSSFSLPSFSSPLLCAPCVLLSSSCHRNQQEWYEQQCLCYRICLKAL